MLDAAGAIQFIQKSGSEADWFDVEALSRLGIPLAACVVTTPHIAGMAAETTARQLEATIGNIARFLAGEVPRRLSNPELLKAPHPRVKHLRR